MNKYLSSFKSYQCESCGKTFDVKQGWARHMQRHAGEPGIEIPEYKELSCSEDNLGKMLKQS